MSLLNLPSDGLPNILVTLAATLQRTRKSLTRADLLARVAPEGGALKDGEMARQTQNRWIELGLFEESKESVRLAQPLEPPASDEIALLRAVQEAARRPAST